VKKYYLGTGKVSGFTFIPLVSAAGIVSLYAGGVDGIMDSGIAVSLAGWLSSPVLLQEKNNAVNEIKVIIRSNLFIILVLQVPLNNSIPAMIVSGT
jgi:hypothetical protein